MPRLVLTIIMLAFLGVPANAQQDDAYLDAGARELVRKARDRRQIADLSVQAYNALAKERISVGMRGWRRDRLIYRREVAGRIEWKQEGDARVEVLGAREMIPIAIKGVQLPDDLTSSMPHLAFDPADPRMMIFWDDDSFVRHPLAADAEEHYRFRTGGTTSIRLQDGRTVRLLELEIIPRRADAQLINGSLWLEAETHAVVQAAFKLARTIDILRDLDDDDEPEDEDDDIPGWLRGMTADLDYVTVEYGLYDLKWWMPRLIAVEGGVKIGPVRMPILYERSYSQFEITGVDIPSTIPIAELLARDSVRRKQENACEHQMTISVNVGTPGAARGDSAAPRRQLSGRCGRFEVVMSADTNALMTSDFLPDDPYSHDEELLTESELNELKERLKGLSGTPMLLGAPDIKYSIFDPGMVRYNRIEGLSVGSSAAVDFGPFIIDGNARIGLADREVNFELGVTKPGESMDLTLKGFRRLNSTDPWRRPFTIGNSLSSLMFGRDESDFYRATGIELRGEPAGAAGGWYSWRIFAQEETSALVSTQFSVRRLIDSRYRFRPNIVADGAKALGGETTLRWHRGLDPAGFRIGGELYGHAATGSFDFGRAAATLRFGIPLPGPFDMATEYSAGSSIDSLPLQHHFYIGGAGTVRGYSAAAMTGESFWRARAELGYGLPAVRLVGFSDAGWAGRRDEFSAGKPLLSVGAGVSLLDGILRFDVARGLREPKGWAAVLYFDAAL